jgi:LysR family transcriptional regulator, carnitine catabolism transcriptional activator
MQVNLTTRQLRAFLTLVGEKNFTRAAAASHLSQPAFSALIRQLEDSLGIRLFERTTRMVELTSEGAEFEPAARRVLDEVGTALGLVNDRAALRRGRASIALLPSLAADWLPKVLSGFRDAHPGIEMQVADVLSEPCIEAVRSGRADFALAAIRADTPELRAEHFCSDGFHLVYLKGHPLQALPQVRPKDVAAWPFIHLSRTSSVRQYLDAATNPRTLASILEVDQLATVSGMVRAGLGISIVPALTLYQFNSPQLATRPIRWKGLTRHIYLVQKRERGLSIAAQSLKDWLLSHPPQISS